MHKNYEKASAEWDSPLFRDTQREFEKVAKRISLDENVFNRLRVPFRALVVSVPFRMDDGSVRVVPGYRPGSRCVADHPAGLKAGHPLGT